MMDISIELQQVEAPKEVAMVSSEAVDDVVVSNLSDSPEEGVVIGDLYVSYYSVAPVQEAVVSLDWTEACMESPNCDVGDLSVTTKSRDVDVDGMDTSDDTMNYTGYDIPYQIVGADSEEGFDESQDQCLHDLMFEVEVETCKEIDIVRASISLNEKIVKVPSSCILDVEL